MQHAIILSQSQANRFSNLFATRLTALHCTEALLDRFDLAGSFAVLARACVPFAQLVQNSAGDAGVRVAGEINHTSSVKRLEASSKPIIPVCTRSSTSTWAGRR